MGHHTADELSAGLDEILRSPAGEGTVELIVRRPAEEEREVLDEAVLDLDEGLVGDVWRSRGSSLMPDRSPNPLAQLTLMNARAAKAIAGSRERWPLAGDQLYVDLDISVGTCRRNPARRGRRGDRGNRRAPHGLREVQRPLRHRGDQVRQQVAGARAATARRQRANRDARHGPHRRRDREALTDRDGVSRGGRYGDDAVSLARGTTTVPDPRRSSSLPASHRRPAVRRP